MSYFLITKDQKCAQFPDTEEISNYAPDKYDASTSSPATSSSHGLQYVLLGIIGFDPLAALAVTCFLVLISLLCRWFELLQQANYISGNNSETDSIRRRRTNKLGKSEDVRRSLRWEEMPVSHRERRGTSVDSFLQGSHEEEEEGEGEEQGAHPQSKTESRRATSYTPTSVASLSDEDDQDFPEHGSRPGLQVSNRPITLVVADGRNDDVDDDD